MSKTTMCVGSVKRGYTTDSSLIRIYHNQDQGEKCVSVTLTLCLISPSRLFLGSQWCLLSCSWMLICREVGTIHTHIVEIPFLLLPVLHVVLTVNPAPKLQTADLNSPGKVGKIGGTSRLKVAIEHILEPEYKNMALPWCELRWRRRCAQYSRARPPGETWTSPPCCCVKWPTDSIT